MSDVRGWFWGTAFLVLFAGWLYVRPTEAQTKPGAAQTKTDGQTVGRYKVQDLQVGRFTYRFLFDTATADYWLLVGSGWELPDQPKEGMPWKDAKPMVGRFQFTAQIPGEFDAALWVIDTSTGRMWSRSVRLRTDVLSGEGWQEVDVPKRTKR